MKQRGKAKHVYKQTEPPRRHLPTTRKSVTHVARHKGDLKIYIIVGFFTNGDPGEVFIKIGKEGSTLAGLLDILGVLISTMLQYEIPWERIARNLRDTNFEPLDSNGNSIAHVIVESVDKILQHYQQELKSVTIS